MNSMFHVSWEIEIDADSAEDAAKQALALIVSQATMAHVFDVTDEGGDVTRVDLDDPE